MTAWLIAIVGSLLFAAAFIWAIRKDERERTLSEAEWAARLAASIQKMAATMESQLVPVVLEASVGVRRFVEAFNKLPPDVREAIRRQGEPQVTKDNA